MGKFILNLNGHTLKLPAKITKESFDYVGRYQIIAEIITQYFKGTQAKSMLDVGGLGSLLDQLLDIPLTIIDEEAPVNDKKEKKGDGARLDVPDGSYDVVVTSDTLEHIDTGDRKNFVSELVRTSNDLVILCAPFADNGAEKAEAKLQQLYTSLTGKPHRWLKEHADYGLPKIAEIRAYFQEAKMAPVVFGHSSVERWRKLMTVNLTSNEMGQFDVHQKLQKINKYYNQNILFNDFTDEGYRIFFVGSKKRELAIKTILNSSERAQNEEFFGLLDDFYENVLVEAEYIPKIRKRIKTLHDENVSLAARVGALEQYKSRTQSLRQKVTKATRKNKQNNTIKKDTV